MIRLMSRRRLLQVSIGVSLLLASCNRQPQSAGNADRRDHNRSVAQIQLTSPAFETAAFIPAEFTCDGTDRSPELKWETAPETTQSWVLIVEDPDAPDKTFVHWVIYDLPPNLQGLAAAIPTQPFLNSGGVQGKNDFGQYGYQGPCPPSGTHQYFFRLYAVDKLLDLPPGTSAETVRAAIQGHVVAQAELMGRYSRQR